LLGFRFQSKGGEISIKYTHLSLEERVELYKSISHGESLRSIARRLSRSDSSLSRELRRHSKYGRSYKPVLANTQARKVALKQRYRAPLKNAVIREYVSSKLKLGWSPQTISGRLPIYAVGNSISFESIYRWIYSKPWLKHKLYKHLDQGHKKRRSKTGRRIHNNSLVLSTRSINLRPITINDRSRAGHWESDLVESGKSDFTALSVSVERVTRFVHISKVTNKTSEQKTRALVKQLHCIPNTLIQSVTIDRGTENSEYLIWEHALNLNVYICNPYHSWEKGAVENTNKRIRRFIPKGVNISDYTDKQIRYIQDWINNKPMKCLQYQTPQEMMQRELNNLRSGS
jgi:transposase, IS30 family